MHVLKRPSIVCLFALFALFAALGAVADTSLPPYVRRTVPVTIFDGGGIPIDEYTDSVSDEGGNRDIEPPASAVSRNMPIFPVVTTKAAPGRLGEPRRGQIKGGPGVPICVLGDDPLSHQWLQINQAALQKMNAVCLVVAVRDQASWERLRAQAGNLPMTPGSFDALATAMGVFVYPILVSPDGLVSQ